MRVQVAEDERNDRIKSEEALLVSRLQSSDVCLNFLKRSKGLSDWFPSLKTGTMRDNRQRQPGAARLHSGDVSVGVKSFAVKKNVAVVPCPIEGDQSEYKIPPLGQKKSVRF